MEKKDIITCLMKKKKLKEFKKKTCFTNGNMSVKVCYKYLFCLFFYYFFKDKIVF